MVAPSRSTLECRDLRVLPAPLDRARRGQPVERLVERAVRGESAVIADRSKFGGDEEAVRLGHALAAKVQQGIEDRHFQRDQRVGLASHGGRMRRYLPIVKRQIADPAARPPVSFGFRGHDRTRLLRDPGRPAHRERRRDQARVPQARPAVAPGRQHGSGGPGAVQGDQRGVPGPVRPRPTVALRHVRAGGSRRRRGRRGRLRRVRWLLGHLRRVLRWRRRGRLGPPRPTATRRRPPLRPPDHLRGSRQGHRQGDRVHGPPALRDLPRQRREGGQRRRSPARSATAVARSARSARRCSGRWST